MVAACLVSACSDIPYYMQSAQGQWDITQRKQDINELILHYEHTHSKKSDSTPTDSNLASSQQRTLNTQLKLVRTVRQFTVDQLHLPQTNSFTEYADLNATSW